jgi:dsDNA-specific endonuclease/ATPase MutS2
MKIKVGDTVRFLNEKGEGIVKEFISAFRARVEITRGIDIEVPIKELVAIPTISLNDMRVSHKDSTVKQKPKPLVSKSHAKDEMFVDLHIEKLQEDHYGLTNSEKLDIQVRHFRKKLELAINGHFTKVNFIHGVGNGVLRQTIRDLLKTYEGIEYSDASYQKFGAGATEVRIVSRNKSRGSI